MMPFMAAPSIGLDGAVDEHGAGGHHLLAGLQPVGDLDQAVLPPGRSVTWRISSVLSAGLATQTCAFSPS